MYSDAEDSKGQMLERIIIFLLYLVSNPELIHQ